MKKIKKSPILTEELSASREIAEIQLERLKAISRERLLSYEETKIYDLLTKNLALAKGEPTDITAASARLVELESVSIDKLEKIAQNIEPSLIDEALASVEKKDESEPKN